MEKKTLAERVTAGMGSWTFLIIQSAFLIVYLLLNNIPALDNLAHIEPWDRYPHVFLNLMLSFQAAYTGPIVLMAQYAQSKRDDQKDQKMEQMTEAIYKLAEAGQADNKTKFEVLGRVIESLNLQSDVLQHISKEVQNRKVETTNGNQRSKDD